MMYIMNAKRKLHEYMEELVVSGRPKRYKNMCQTEVSAYRSVACQTDEEKEIKYSKTEVEKIIRNTKNEMVSKYYEFVGKSNIVEKVIHSQKCEL